METSLPEQFTPEEAWQITCHEAGHAVVGVRHQIVFLHVERGDGECGQVPVGVGPIENPTRTWTQDELSRWQQFYAGGAAAEQPDPDPGASAEAGFVRSTVEATPESSPSRT